MHYYISFTSTDYQQFYASELVVDALKNIQGLIQKNPLQFVSTEGYPWTIIQLAICNTEGNYAVNENDIYPEINCIEIIRSSEELDGFHQLLIEKIQTLTGWKSITDNDDFTFSEEEYTHYLMAERRCYTWTLVNYGNYSLNRATKMAEEFYQLEPRDELVFHDQAWHWAMLKIFGSNYWIARPDLLTPPDEYVRLWKS